MASETADDCNNFPEPEQVAPYSIQIGVLALVDDFGFQVPKKLAIGALSEQFSFTARRWSGGSVLCAHWLPRSDGVDASKVINHEL